MRCDLSLSLFPLTHLKFHASSHRPTRTRGVQKVLQLDHKEEWKFYKLHFIFQYNHH